MAISFAGGTDKVAFGNVGRPIAIGAFHFRLKTTQTTTNVGVMAMWNSGSRDGLGLILNNTANKIEMVGYPFSGSPAVTLAGATTVNDGNWHGIGGNWNITNGAKNELFVDGASDGSQNASASWSIDALVAGTPLTLGRFDDAFWPSFVGQIAGLAVWNRALLPDEWVSLARGFSPKLLNPVFYAPLVHSANNMREPPATGISGVTVTGTSFSDHPRVIGF